MAKAEHVRRRIGRAGLVALLVSACAGNPAAPTNPAASKRPPGKGGASAAPGPEPTGGGSPAAQPTTSATPAASPAPGASPVASVAPPAGVSPAPAASPTPFFGLPPAQAAIATRAGGRLMAIAQIGFAQNRGKLAADGLTGLAGSTLPVGVVSNAGGRIIANNGGGIIANNGGGLISEIGGGLVSNNGGGLVSNNGGGLVSNNGGGLVSNNGGGYRLAQAAAASPVPVPPPSLVAGAGETLYADRRWPDGRRTMLFVKNVQNTDDQFRRVQVRADGSASNETRLETLEKWPNGRVKRATYHIADFYPDGTVRAFQAYDYQPDDAGKTLRIAFDPGASRVREPATGVAVTFEKFEVDVPNRTGAFAYAYTHLGATEAGTLVDVVPLPSGEIPLTYDDPLAYYDGDATLTDAAGKVIYTKKQRRAGDVVTRTYDLQDGLLAELKRESPTTYAGVLKVDGAQAATLTLETRTNGSVLFKLVFPEAPDRPVELGYGLADDAPAAPTPAPSPAQPTVGLVAGRATAAFADGDGPAAAFNTVSDLAASTVDPNRFYVADTLNHRVRTLTLTSGMARVGTLAGDGRNAHADGPGAEASFQGPVGLAVAPGAGGAETVYVSDQGGHRIRAIAVAADGAATVSTVAGDGTAGFADGAGDAARFNQPGGLAWDPASGLYVADIANHRVRLVDVAGGTPAVGTLFGEDAGMADGPAASARADRPFDLAIDGQRRLYVADRGNKRIRRVDLAAAGHPVATLAGTGVLLDSFRDGPALQAGMNPPLAIALDAAGRAYVTYADVRVLTPGGQLLTLAGSLRGGAADGPADAAAFQPIYGIAIGPAGQVLVTDTHRVRAIVPPPGASLFP